MTTATKTINFPDGTATSAASDANTVAVIASPADADLLRKYELAAAQAALHTAEQIESALATPSLRLVEGQPGVDTSTPVVNLAYLGTTDVSILLDQDGNERLINTDFSSDGPMFLDTGRTALDALTATARERVAQLHEQSKQHRVAADAGANDSRLKWRVLRWMPTEAAAMKFMAKLTKYEEIGSTVSIVRGTVSDEVSSPIESGDSQKLALRYGQLQEENQTTEAEMYDWLPEQRLLHKAGFAHRLT